MRKTLLQQIVKPYERGKQLVDGEPFLMELRRYANDKTLTTAEWQVCCNCGLQHLHYYQVLELQGKWYLIVRAFRKEKT